MTAGICVCGLPLCLRSSVLSAVFRFVCGLPFCLRSSVSVFGFCLGSLSSVFCLLSSVSVFCLCLLSYVLCLQLCIPHSAFRMDLRNRSWRRFGVLLSEPKGRARPKLLYSVSGRDCVKRLKNLRTSIPPSS
jgi:hypothetical protein